MTRLHTHPSSLELTFVDLFPFTVLVVCFMILLMDECIFSACWHLDPWLDFHSSINAICRLRFWFELFITAALFILFVVVNLWVWRYEADFADRKNSIDWATTELFETTYGILFYSFRCSACHIESSLNVITIAQRYLLLSVIDIAFLSSANRLH